MEETNRKPSAITSSCHVVAMPFPVTQEWHNLLSSYEKPPNVHFRTIPNVIPSELVRAKDFPGFLEAVATNLEVPFEKVLDELHPGVDVIVADTCLNWVVRVGNHRSIPVASFWTMSATVFSVFLHFDLLSQNGHFPVQLSERGEEVVDYIPGVPPTRLRDLPAFFHGSGRKTLHRALEDASMVPKAQYLLFTSAYELEAGVVDALKSKFPFPVYSVGPSIPYLELQDNSCLTTSDQNDVPDYLKWLNSQPKESVLYVSMGSFLSMSSAQMEEIICGVCSSGVRFLWVSRGATTLFKDVHVNTGLIVPWCDQLRVLSHPSIGGFWTHCGWNSAMEAVFSGIPMLTSPIAWDQTPNSKKIVDDWNIGWRVKQGVDLERLITREDVAKLVKSFMEPESDEVKQMRKKAKELQEACQAAIADGGSSHTNLKSFIRDISHGEHK
ncbi:UDP-glycosyltransferase 87A1-like isoform X2 [Mercurialis annua]|uniref:UDP-glycosyltransferase 87A1-like isoform X2 n=1 Tax=Mercurialis annua TaxID=3986 RepID=UPI0021610434|nr:UDP-glycosyltransferase 87A1-like isoform X2 [Mercurialis annua]